MKSAMPNHRLERAVAVGTPERPGNRPPYAPMVAARLIGLWGILLLISFGPIANCLPFATGAGSLDYVDAGFVITCAFFFTQGLGLRAGKLWAVRMFNWSSWAMIIYYPFDLAVALYLFFGEAPSAQDPLAPGLGVVLFFFCALEPIGFFFLFRGLRRVRWLDPASLPHEWEPPARVG